MAETLHTQGPWKWHWRHEDGIATGSVFAEQRPGHAYAVAMTPRYQTQAQWEADARLIAAAPELLDACRAVQRYFDDHLLGDPQGEHEHRQLRMLVQDAIAKATS